jgi:hypothetical protein
MPITSRIADAPEDEASAAPCEDPKHFVPEKKRKPGVYLHTCPTCGLPKRFRVEVEEEETDG